ncbi:MAG: response regulator, partial [Planctomycetota bacterium]
MNRKLLRVRLEDEGHTVLDASDGVIALEILRSDEIDAVVSDILMPNMDGFRLCREIRCDPQLWHLPFVLYTSTYDSPSDRELAAAVGADRYVVKPAPVKEVLDALAQAAQAPRRTGPPPNDLAVDERWILRQYSEALVQKLEDRNVQLTTLLGDLRDAHQHIQALNRDLEKRVEQRTAQLKAANEQLEASNRFKTMFLASISHELRTPIAASMATAEALRQSTRNPLTPDQLASVRNIVGAGEHLLSLVNDLIDIASLASGSVQLSPAPLNLAELCVQTVETLEQMAEDRGITLHQRIDPSIGRVMGDDRRLRQILFNLIGNAIKFTPRGGRVSLEADTLPDGQVRMRVRDTGIGMPPELIPNLFVPFMRGDATRVARIEGAGLGLALVGQLLGIMRGRIDVESEVGHGSVFTVVIPLPTAEPPPKIRPRPASAPPFRVLLAEDNQVLRDTTADVLAQCGYTVTAMEDGQKVLDMVATPGAVAFDVILLDMQMPGADGVTCLEAMKADGRFDHIPRVIMTGHAMQPRFTEAGATHFLQKPYRLADL